MIRFFYLSVTLCCGFFLLAGMLGCVRPAPEPQEAAVPAKQEPDAANCGIEGVYETRLVSTDPKSRGKSREPSIGTRSGVTIAFKSLDTGKIVRGVSGNGGSFRICAKPGKYKLSGKDGGELTNPFVTPDEPNVDLFGVVSVEPNAFTKVRIQENTGKD
jgi:hypothetical protein